MKLTKFSVTNFRSITTAHKIKVENLTVLVGKNNEGKSNILQALTIAMNVMMFFSDNPNRPLIFNSIINRRIGYSWEKDFPISLQEKFPEKKTILDLSFEVNDDELNSIRIDTGIRISNKLIPIRVSLGISNFQIDIPQKGSPAFKMQKSNITKFICDKISFNFIPAVRTEHDAVSVIDDIIRNDLQDLYNNEEYVAAVEKTKKMQQDKLDEIASRIIQPLNMFLPTIKSVSINMKNDERKWVRRNVIDIIIDDGNATSIAYKGDGIKSLTALAMLNATTPVNTVAVVAIEEPESHLHPEAIHQLVETINMLSESRQVIITTHNPLFVSRNNLSSNIIVIGGSARPAKNIKEIRDTLGVIPSDNLINAQFVLLVEGGDDKIALTSLLRYYSPKIKKALSENRLDIKAMSGVGNLTYELNTLRGWLCSYIVFLDNDEAGREASKKAFERGLLEEFSVKYSICNGQVSSEIEDCYNVDIYAEKIYEKFGVNINISGFRGNKKWSDRMRNVFLSSGQQWNDDMERKVKMEVAIAISEHCDKALNLHKRNSIDALIISVENMIS